ncbi:MAG: 2-C-methyl-D-erythritol 4-phosphate cytidylyltransferase [Steroidobacteraceae bacterium]
MTEHSYWAVIPAAGSGARFGSVTPKQYLPLAGKTVIEWALSPFLADDRCRAVVVAIAADDAHWSRLAVTHPKLRVTQGGSDRAQSVLSGLLELQEVTTNSWVLVHDAARPCLHANDLQHLLNAATPELVGALLATPLADTLKQADAEQRIVKTLPRTRLWRAQTPQMFRLGMLRDALQSAISNGVSVTDEASAMEAMGYSVRLVAGRTDNLKITLPEDLLLAGSILAAHASTNAA